MKLSVSALLLVLFCLTGLVFQGESQSEDENLALEYKWPWFSFPIPRYHQLPQYPKTTKKPLITPECIEAKLALSSCVKEKLVSTWFSKPFVKDCCDPIANHKKSCPDFIFKIDELLIPHYIKDACHAFVPKDKHATGPSAGPSSGPSAGPSSGPSGFNTYPK
ncbi:hypothetical protein POM88_034054 [Heracleum sosnowskyi]|uniref:Prolamin-like domain-containing protein n=1 Tax=Heracleum sosnowskyi TaxID=360622 RepID=A0AAD8HKP2_9APIA|nr:hypothetical protein POM88_034054 [Heracleum sosnowskyi]